MTQEVTTTAAETGEAEGKPRVARKSRAAGEPKRKTKSDAVLALLTRPRGATIDEMMKATGWQSHSVRGFLAGTVKKKLGRQVVSDASEKGRIYRITAETQ